MYDLKAMAFEPDVDNICRMFEWIQTKEGAEYWSRINCRYTKDSLPTEAAAKIQAMRDQYERENRPAVGVLHDWDGSSKTPVPEGADHTFWNKGDQCVYRSRFCGGDWSSVSQYLVHSYPPETTTKTGQVTYTNGNPDFDTWVADTP